MMQDTSARIEAEEDDYENDRDSAFGSSIGEISTASIGSSILKYREENGRTYHAYKEGKYALPNDESEKDRLDLQHHLYSLTYGGKLHLCEIPKDKTIHRALDVGTGTGIWAIDYADENPESQVIGIDLSPIQPSFIPPNLSFEIDDLEEPWTFSQPFDLIHARMMTGSIASWPAFFKQAFSSLSPGGFIEISDLTFPLLTDDDSFPPDSALRKWGEYLKESGRNLGRPMDSAEKYREQLEECGFVDVREKRFKWPMNRWPKDKKMKELGAWNHENMAPDCAGLSMAFFTRGLGWTAQEVEFFSMKVRQEMKDTKIHAYVPIYTVWGRKPS